MITNVEKMHGDTNRAQDQETGSYKYRCKPSAGEVYPVRHAAGEK